MICPLVGQSPHHLKNNQHFIQHIKEVKLEPWEVMTSYDVKAFFTSVPMDPSINIIKQKQQDQLLSQSTKMSIQQVVTLLEFCLNNTDFLFQGKYYEQVHGAVMGCPISNLITNLFMEEFEVKALNSATHTPHLWLRYVDDTFVIQEAKYSQQLLQHINAQDPHIQFTVCCHVYVTGAHKRTCVDHWNMPNHHTSICHE